MPPRPTSEAGTVVAGRYKIKGLLGRGGLAKVYLAEDGTTGEQLALKLLQ